MKKYAALATLPIISVLFFLITMNGMQHAEQSLTTLYTEHTALLEQIAANPAQRENLTKQFTEKITLDAQEQARLARSTRMQKIVDALAFSTPHCVNAPKSTDCRVYSEALIAEAKNRHAKILFLTGQEPHRESILSAAPYTMKDHARTLLILALEGLAITSIALWLWSRR